MITKRDIAVALLTLSGTAVLGAVSQGAPPILGPTVFDWNKMVAKKTAVGELRSLTKGPTATVDELEMHITTLNPGQNSGEPRKHLQEEVLVVKEGQVEAHIDGKTQTVGPAPGRGCAGRRGCRRGPGRVRRRRAAGDQRPLRPRPRAGVRRGPR